MRSSFNPTTKHINELREQTQAKDAKIENPTQAAQAHDSGHIDDECKDLAELKQRTASLEINLKTVVEQRDDAQNMYAASEAALVDIIAKFTTCHDELQALQTEVPVLRATVDESRLKDEEEQRSLEQLQLQMKDLTDGLKAEQAAHKATQQQLKDPSAKIASTQLNLDQSEEEARELKIDCATLHEECGTLRDALEDDLEDRRRDNEDLSEERDNAAKAQADAVYEMLKIDQDLAALESELQSKTTMLEKALEKNKVLDELRDTPEETQTTTEDSLEGDTMVELDAYEDTKHVELKTPIGGASGTVQAPTAHPSSPPATGSD